MFTDCPPIQSGTGALASNRDTAFGTTITFSCPIGQEFATGKSRITTQCLDGGKWSTTYIPSCQGQLSYLIVFKGSSINLMWFSKESEKT